MFFVFFACSTNIKNNTPYWCINVKVSSGIPRWKVETFCVVQKSKNGLVLKGLITYFIITISWNLLEIHSLFDYIYYIFCFNSRLHLFGLCIVGKTEFSCFLFSLKSGQKWYIILIISVKLYIILESARS